MRDPALAGALETEADARALARRAVPGAHHRAPDVVNRELLAAACRDAGLTRTRAAQRSRVHRGLLKLGFYGLWKKIGP